MYQQTLKKIGMGMVLTLACSMASASVFTEAQLKEINTLKQNALNSELAWKLDESLTTEVGHRMIGSEGDKKAIKWAQKNMKALGFDRVWTEEVTFTEWVRGDLDAKIVSPYPHKVVAIGLGGSIGTGPKGIQAQVAHFKTFADLKAAKPGSLKGKIAFVSHRMTREKDGRGYGPVVGGRSQGAIVAAEKGAVAYILRSVGSDNNRVGHTGTMRYKEGVNRIPAAALSNPDADLLVRQIERGKPVEFFLKMSAERRDGNTVKSANVIGEITGSEHPEDFVVMAAHLDSWDVGTGALDDGLGVSITMAAGHLISKLPKRPKRSIRVILFAGEEVGLVGAYQYLEKNKAIMGNHVIGYEWDFANGSIYDLRPGVGPESLNAVREFAQLIAPLGVSLNPKNNSRGNSDIIPLVAAGMPAVSFAADGTDYFDHHHTENDTLDKVDKAALPGNTAIYAMFAYFAANTGVDFRK